MRLAESILYRLRVAVFPGILFASPRFHFPPVASSRPTMHARLESAGEELQ